MSHYAKVVNGVVQQVIVAEEDFINSFADPEPGTWIQTSYNTRGNVHYSPNSNVPDGGVALRGNYAGPGYLYDAQNDVFYPPKPFNSWVMNNATWTWGAPVPYPTDGNTYTWNESATTWELLPSSD